MKETKKAGCAFCKRFYQLRRFHDEIRKQIGVVFPDYKSSIEKSYKCAIIFYYLGNRTDSGRDYELNYCPECGRKIKGGK